MKKIIFFTLLLFTMGAYAQDFPDPYCDITMIYAVEEITFVEFGDTEITNDNSLDALIDKTSTVVDVIPGETYTIVVKGNTAGGYENDITAFVDWDQNNVLDDAGEVFPVGVLYNSSGNDNVSVSTEITVPEDAVPGETRIRITKVYGDGVFDIALLDPCAISVSFLDDEPESSYGQALDFTLNVLSDEEELCEAPQNIEVEDITENSALLTWESTMDAEDIQGWEVIYGPAGFDIDGEEGVAVETDETMLEIEGLDAKTEYDVYVHTICGDNASDWQGPVSFTTEDSQEGGFSDPYCDIDDPMIDVEAITSVEFDDTVIENDNDTDVLVDYTSTVINVEQGQTYTLNVEGFTDGNFDNYIVAFIDWNQNEILDDEGEVYEVGVITNSSGDDGVSASIEITVPDDALVGETRIRITKTYGDEDSPAIIDPCSIVMDAFGMGAFASYGQAIDFTLDVGLMNVNRFDENALTVYPVPTDNFLNIAYQSQLKNVKIYNLLGQEVISENPNTLEAKIDVSNLAEGMYMVRLNTEEGTHNFRFVKK